MSNTLQHHPFAPPANPGASATVDVFDTTVSNGSTLQNIGQHRGIAGVVGTMLFDQAVTFTLQEVDRSGAPTWRTVMTVAIAANTPYPLKVRFMGAGTRGRITTGGTPPGIWMVELSLTSGEV